MEEIIETSKAEEVIAPNCTINFDDGKGNSSLVSIKNEDMPKLAEAFYKFCIKNKIDAEITVNGKSTSSVS